jgi:hypothetical protein
MADKLVSTPTPTLGGGLLQQDRATGIYEIVCALMIFLLKRFLPLSMV